MEPAPGRGDLESRHLLPGGSAPIRGDRRPKQKARPRGRAHPEGSHGLRLQKFQELLPRETGLFQDSEESAPLQIFTVERDGDDSQPVRVPVEAVGSGGVIEKKPCPLQGPNNHFGGAGREAGHAGERLTRTRSVTGSPRSRGISSPCFRRLSR